MRDIIWMSAITGYKRRFLAAAMLLALASCSTTEVASVEEPPVAPMTGETNDPAPGFENVAPGSKEDFILNVGRRVYFTQDSAALDSVVERKFKKKQELIDKNVAVIQAGWDFAAKNGWDEISKAAKKAEDAATAKA